MSKLFNRAYSLVIGKQGSKGILIDNLRITFNCVLNTDSTPNKATISIVNLSNNTIEVISTENMLCVLKVGYMYTTSDPCIDIIFEGEITKVETLQQGADKITTLTVQEKQFTLNNKHISINFARAISTENVVRELLKGLDYNSKVINLCISNAKNKGITLAKTFPEGISLIGNIRTLLDRVLLREKLVWYTINGIPFIDNILPSVKKKEAILLTPYTGLLSIPFPIYKKTINKDATTIVGIKCKALLQPSLLPGTIIKVECNSHVGYHKIIETTFTGDTHGGDWIAEVTTLNG